MLTRTRSALSRIRNTVTSRIRVQRGHRGGLSVHFGEAWPVASGSDPDMRHTDFNYYRRIGGGATAQIDVGAIDRMIQVSRYLTITNGVARRIIELANDYVLGDGLAPQAKDEDFQDWLDEYWQGYGNQWHLQQFRWHENFRRDGNLIALPNTNAAGNTAWSWIDPLWVKDVLPESAVYKDGGRMDAPGMVTLKDDCAITLADGRKLEELYCIRRDPNPSSKTYGRLVGDCFFFSINRAPGSLWGVPDITPVADWIVHLDYVLTQIVERTSLLNNLVWDMQLDGMDENEIADYLQRRFPRGMQPGTIYGHNERQKLEPAKTAMGEAYAVDKYMLTVLRHILGPLGYPEHWFAYGDTSNRATSVSAGDPTLQSLKSKRRMYSQIHMNMLDYAIDQAILAGTLSVDDEARQSLELVAPPLDVRDTAKLAGGFASFIAGLQVAETAEYFSKDECARAASVYAQGMGAEIEPLTEEEREKMAAEREDEVDEPVPIGLPDDEEIEQEAARSARRIYAAT